MSELIERYVHQVGRYLPSKERAEIQAELRSQIQDQLEDRYEGAPTQTDVAAVLKELGDPRRMAASYGGEQYLVGPDLYPCLLYTSKELSSEQVDTMVIFLRSLTGELPADYTAAPELPLAE